MVNCDIPWNPITLEPRIGRIARTRQERPAVDIVNLFYQGTAGWNACDAMPGRRNAIHRNASAYQPTLYDAAPAITMSDLRRDLAEPVPLPEGRTAEPHGGPPLATTSAAACEHNGSDTEWFAPGSPWWPAPDTTRQQGRKPPPPIRSTGSRMMP